VKVNVSISILLVQLDAECKVGVTALNDDKQKGCSAYDISFE